MFCCRCNKNFGIIGLRKSIKYARFNVTIINARQEKSDASVGRERVITEAKRIGSIFPVTKYQGWLLFLNREVKYYFMIIIIF